MRLFQISLVVSFQFVGTGSLELFLKVFNPFLEPACRRFKLAVFSRQFFFFGLDFVPVDFKPGGFRLNLFQIFSACSSVMLSLIPIKNALSIVRPP